MVLPSKTIRKLNKGNETTFYQMAHIYGFINFKTIKNIQYCIMLPVELSISKIKSSGHCFLSNEPYLSLHQSENHKRIFNIATMALPTGTVRKISKDIGNYSL